MGLERRTVPSTVANARPTEYRGDGNKDTKRQLGTPGRLIVSRWPWLPVVLSVGLLGISWYGLSFEGAQMTYSGSCEGYDGVLHIAHGDKEGGAGTIFFLFIVNQLIYADAHNLVPWVHMNNVSRYVYDPVAHGTQETNRFHMNTAVEASWAGFVDPISHKGARYPGPPKFGQQPEKSEEIVVVGNGVWSSYFEPVSYFSPHSPTCLSLPLIRLSYVHILPAMHLNYPKGIRSWRYGGMPASLRQDDMSYDEWFRPMRERGSEMVQKYVKFRPHMQQLAQQANPTDGNCLAIHIRHSDKANRRKRIPVKAFRPFVQAYAQEQSKHSKPWSIFLATDSGLVIQEIQTTWDSDIVEYMRWQNQVTRSNDTTPVFTLSSRHATNMEVLVDILALSKCSMMLHGLSAVSEAAHYLNPLLKHNRSVNLDVPEHVDVELFQTWVQEKGGVA